MKNLATKVFYNGNIITVDNDNTIVNCVAIKEDKIIFVGEYENATKFIDEYTELIDLEGKTMLPGFYDSHGHISGRALLTSGIDMIGKIHSIDDCIKFLKDFIKTKDEGSIILGYGYDDANIKEERMPTKDELDKISTRQPVLVIHISQHSAVLNTYALNLSEDITDIENHTGQVSEEELITYYHKYIPKPTPTDIMNSIIEEGKAYASSGVTTAADAGSAIQGLSYMPIFEEIDKNKLVDTRIRMSISYDGSNMDEYLDKLRKLEKKSSDMIKIYGIKMFYDGSITPKTAYLNEVYKDTNVYGHSVITKETLFENVKKAHQSGVQCIIHANGDRAIDEVVEAYENAQKSDGNNSLRHTVIHAQMASEKSLDKMKELNIVPSFFVLHTYYWGEIHRKLIIGEERAQRISPLKSALNRGIKFTTHCDTPVIPQDPLGSIDAAVNRVTKKGHILGKEERISVIDAIRSYTINAAYQGFEEDIKGSIEIGKLADFVVLEENPLTCEVSKIKDVRILETIVGGKSIFKNKLITAEVN